MENTATSAYDGRLSLEDRVRHYGCTELVSLEEGLANPDQLSYLDLLPRGRNTARPAPVAAVAEHQGVALLYLVDDPDGNLSAKEREALQGLLANRSDPAWLGVVKTGSLEVFPIGFPSVDRGLTRIQVIRSSASEAPLFFQGLVQGTFQGNRRTESSDYVFQKIFGLLRRTSEAFVPSGMLAPLDVLSMAGRALFFRFLIDRKIVVPGELGEICEGATNLKGVFRCAESAALTSVWLDETFNGDFLTLVNEGIPVEDHDERLAAYRAFYQEAHESTDGRIFLHLTAILEGWEVVGEQLQGELDWGDLDFAHIPVGVLSQVYESFSHIDDPEKAQRESVHYTPRIIAELMVDQALSADPAAATARVLDPSCGAGIFLVLAFRRLYQERWRQDGKRPDYRVIQRILYEQLHGFEISESALRLAALSLYITAIELNASPRPPKSLKFPKSLRGVVLHHVGGAQMRAIGPFWLGSLQDDVARAFAGDFDLVIGNPPWTRLRESEVQSSEKAVAARRKSKEKALSELMNDEYTRIGKDVLAARGLDELARRYRNPDKNPDLPFVWRATQWAREDGIIAFALPARILQRAGDRGSVVWESLLRCVSVTGILNGANLRKTGVWRDVDFPWCIVFARNRTCDKGGQFHFSAPVYDASLNQHARFRIDYEAAAAVSVRETLDRPWLLKALSLGTRRDVDVMAQIIDAFPQTLANVWKRWDPKGEKTGQGFNRSPKLTQKPADFLAVLPVFERPERGFSLRGLTFQTFEAAYGVASAHMPRTKALYQPPLVILPQSPGENPKAAQAYLSGIPLAFSQSFYGYSTEGRPCAEEICALIYLLAHSSLFRFFCLMTSRRSGLDRQTFNKREFDALPFPDVASLPRSEKRQILELAGRLEEDADKPWEEIDAFLFALYGLDDGDVQVAKDTLFASAYYRREGRQALAPPTSAIRSRFAAELQDLLQPFFKVCGTSLVVAEPPFQQDVWREPWFFLSLRRPESGPDANVSPGLLVAAMQQANESGASRVIVRAPEKQGLLVGLLSQRRWWTVTRARMCGRHILREHLDAFGIDGEGESHD